MSRVGDTGAVVDEETDKQQAEQPGPGGRYHLVPVRRRPDMVRFLVAGGFLGFVVGAVLGRYGPDAPNSSALQEIILLGATGLLVGLLVASVVYLVAERISDR